jgi:hypothetical protein
MQDARDMSLAQQATVEAITAQAFVDNNAVQAVAAVANAAGAAATEQEVDHHEPKQCT